MILTKFLDVQTQRKNCLGQLRELQYCPTKVRVANAPSDNLVVSVKVTKHMISAYEETWSTVETQEFLALELENGKQLILDINIGLYCRRRVVFVIGTHFK